MIYQGSKAKLKNIFITEMALKEEYEELNK